MDEDFFEKDLMRACLNHEWLCLCKAKLCIKDFRSVCWDTSERDPVNTGDDV